MSATSRCLIGRFLSCALVVTVALVRTAYAADVSSQVSVTGLTFVSSSRVGRTVYEYTYRVSLLNSGGALTGVTATVTSTSAGTQIADGTVSAGNLGAGAGASPTDTITIRQDRTVPFSSAVLRWSVAGTLAAVEGILVPGDPLATIADAMPDHFSPRVVSDAEISVDPNSGARVIRTALYIAFKETATVGEVNGVLGSISGRILASFAGNGFVSVGIPDPGDLAGLDALIGILKENPIVNLVRRDTLPEPSALPQEKFSDNTRSYLDHHIAVRAAASWNARRAIVNTPALERPTILITDWFGDGAPNLPFVQLNWKNGSDFATGDLDSHGYHVTGILAGGFGGTTPVGEVTGMYPSGTPIEAPLNGYVIDNVGPAISSGYHGLWKRIKDISGNVVVNTSLSYIDVKCADSSELMSNAIDAAGGWLYLLRKESGLLKRSTNENRFFHASAAGNVDCDNGKDADPSRQLAKFASDYAAAALFSQAELEGAEPLANTLAVENRTVFPSLSATDPEDASCTHLASYVGGHISGIGSRAETDSGVWSYYDSTPSRGDRMSGTSMAAPQVAGLAAYLWTLRPTLTGPEVADRIKKHARPVACVGDKSSTPLIDAYSTILSADLSIDDAPARSAILDVVGAGGAEGFDSMFSFDDFRIFLEEFAKRISVGKAAEIDYSRYDLNGDGNTGGPITPGAYAAFDLDLDQELNEKEKSVSDMEVLCYYTWTSLFSGATDEVHRAIDDVNRSYPTANLSCPDLEILAATGSPGGPFGNSFSFFDSKVSINNDGAVAFVGFDSDSASAGYIASGTNVVRRTTLESAFTSRRFGGASINNSQVPEVAHRELIPVSPSTYMIRKWKSDTDLTMIGRSSGIIGGLCTGGSRAGQTCFSSTDCPIIGLETLDFAACSLGPSAPFDSATFWLNINDAGLVGFLGLVDGSTQNGLFAGTSEADLTRLLTFPTSTVIRPQVANSNEIVYFDGAIKVVSYPAAVVSTIASVPTYNSITSERPGISADGSFVVFAGAQFAGQSGVYLARRAPSPQSWKPVDTSGDPTSPVGAFTAFATRPRYAVATQANPASVGSTLVTIVFVGTRTNTPAGETAPVTREGIYRTTVNIDSSDNLTIITPPSVVIEKSTVLAQNGKTIADFDLWDPLSDNGRYVAFWASFTDGTVAVLRAR